MTLLDQLTCDIVLDAAYEWLCRRRQQYSANADVWNFRRSWPQEKQQIVDQLRAGCFRLSLLARTTLKNGEETDLWSARDALVLKALSIVLATVLPMSPRCTHVKGHGGAKSAVRDVQARLPMNRFVLRTDVRSYYASIDHVPLMDHLARFVRDRTVLNLCGQYLKRTAERGGWFWSYDKGISLGCPLSPLMGAFFLSDLDRRMERTGLFYVRFMDDILVLTPTRPKLRAAVKAVSSVLASLRLEKHPDKTFIGRITKGFDFLGYRFGEGVLKVPRLRSSSSSNMRPCFTSEGEGSASKLRRSGGMFGGGSAGRQVV